MVAPTVTALSVSAAEMATMVRFTENPDMILIPFCFAGRVERFRPNAIHEACQGPKSADFRLAQRAKEATLRQGSAYCPNPPWG